MKKRLPILLAAAIMMIMCACAPIVIQQTATPDLPAVNPQAVSQVGRRNIRLYFRVADEAFIGSELRQLDVNADETAEEAAFRGLAGGPVTALTQLTPLIPPGTELISIEISSGILFLTLSSDFLNPAAAMPGGWEQEPAFVEQALIEKRLALSAITNTLTELGACDRVRIQIEEGSSGDVPREILALFEGDPLAYSNEFVLTPANALGTALTALSEKNWEQLSRLVSSSEQLTESRIASELSAIGELVDFELGGDSTAPGGETAVVAASVHIEAEDGVTRSRESIPVRVTRVQEVFRVDYESLLRLLGAEGEG